MVTRPRPHGLAFAAGTLAFFLFATVGTLAAMTVLVSGVVMPIMVAVAVVLLLQRRAYHRYRRYATAYPQHRPVARTRGTVQQLPPPSGLPLDLRWAHARHRFAALRTEYAGYECDPMLVLRLPALADVRVPSTERFVEAFAEAQALDTDREPPTAHAAAFVAAVDRACRAWRAAWDAAERIRLSRLSLEERAAVEKIVKLLTMARDSDSDAERLTAYAKARTELARLERSGALRLPHPAQAALDAAGRGQLPARETA